MEHLHRHCETDPGENFGTHEGFVPWQTVGGAKKSFGHFIAFFLDNRVGWRETIAASHGRFGIFDTSLFPIISWAFWEVHHTNTKDHWRYEIKAHGDSIGSGAGVFIGSEIDTGRNEHSGSNEKLITPVMRRIS